MTSESQEGDDEEESVTMTLEEADTNSDNELSQEELEALTVAQLKALAQELEISLTATTKAEIIAEILAAQEANEEQQGG
jgi:hypothetical protein